MISRSAVTLITFVLIFSGCASLDRFSDPQDPPHISLAHPFRYISPKCADMDTNVDVAYGVRLREAKYWKVPICIPPRNLGLEELDRISAQRKASEEESAKAYAKWEQSHPTTSVKASSDTPLCYTENAEEKIKLYLLTDFSFTHLGIIVNDVYDLRYNETPLRSGGLDKSCSSKIVFNNGNEANFDYVLKRINGKDYVTPH
jgi:hypothetical protein